MDFLDQYKKKRLIAALEGQGMLDPPMINEVMQRLIGSDAERRATYKKWCSMVTPCGGEPDVANQVILASLLSHLRLDILEKEVVDKVEELGMKLICARLLEAYFQYCMGTGDQYERANETAKLSWFGGSNDSRLGQVYLVLTWEGWDPFKEQVAVGATAD